MNNGAAHPSRMRGPDGDNLPGAAMDTAEADDPSGAPVTLEQLADLQAGLLDDDTAAHLRQRVRNEPEAARLLAALEQVRRDLARLGNDGTSAPDPPESVTSRVTAALRSAPPAHAVRSASPHRVRGLLTAVGLAAALTGLGVGVAMLFRDADTVTSTTPTAKHITVAPREIPLSDSQLIELSHRPPDFAQLSDPRRRGSCLSGLGYSAETPVLGAQPIDMTGRPGVLLLLPGDASTEMAALVVGPNCSAADTGLLASSTVKRP